MTIYALTIKNIENEIYIGKTNNLQQRLYAHKSSCAGKNDRIVYKWINNYGWDNVIPLVLCECNENEADDKELFYIKLYENKGYKIYNQQLTKDYNPDTSKKYCDKREDIWNDYVNSDISKNELATKYNVSTSLISKIIQEHGGSNRKSKLYGKFEEIQRKIIDGVPIRQLAREYGVSKNAISNVNKGITAYNPNLSYPLNKLKV